MSQPLVGSSVEIRCDLVHIGRMLIRIVAKGRWLQGSGSPSPGRPVSSRQKISERLLADLAVLWERQGQEVLERLASTPILHRPLGWPLDIDRSRQPRLRKAGGHAVGLYIALTSVSGKFSRAACNMGLGGWYRSGETDRIRQSRHWVKTKNCKHPVRQRVMEPFG
jgi:hypothetical protein